MAVRPDIALQAQAINPVAALAGGQQATENIKTASIREAMLNQQAANTALESGLLRQRQEAEDLQIQEAQRQQSNAKSLVMNQLFKELKKTPPAQRAGVASAAIPSLQGFGITPEQIGQLDVSDDGLDQGIAATNAFVQQQQGPNKSFGATTTIQKDDGSLVRLTEVRDRSAGTVELIETPIQGDLVTSAGETPEERVARELTVTEGKADIKTKQAVEQEEAIREAKLTTAQRLSEIETTAKRNQEFSANQVARLDEAISSGLNAAGALPDIRRGIELLTSVRTGGINANAKAITDFFGTTSGDIGELNNLLGGNILQGLQNFKGQISDGERKFLTEMETSFGQGTAFNAAQLARMKRIYEREVDNALKAANIAGDEFSLGILTDAVEADPSGFSSDVAEKAQSNLDFVNNL